MLGTTALTSTVVAQKQPWDHMGVAVSLGPGCWPLTQSKIFGVITF